MQRLHSFGLTALVLASGSLLTAPARAQDANSTTASTTATEVPDSKGFYATLGVGGA